jgi:hypothetical protein
VRYKCAFNDEVHSWILTFNNPPYDG